MGGKHTMKLTLLSWVLALIFLLSGGAKLAGLEFEIAAFERWGYPWWFMYLTGVIEVVGGVGLLLRRLAALASVGLAAVMVGAIATHLIHAEWGMLVVATVIFAAAVLRGWFGRSEIVSLLR